MITKRKCLKLAILIVTILTCYCICSVLYFIVCEQKRLNSKWNLNEWIQIPQVDDRGNYSTTHHCEEMMMSQDQMRIRRHSLRRIIVNDEHKLLYWSIPKIACTNLRRVFLILTGKTNQTNPLKLKSNDVHYKYNKYLKHLHQYSSEQIGYRLQHYRKIIFVREPFERLLSAYRSKFLSQKVNNDFKMLLGRKIITTFRANASQESLKHGNDVTFGEFIQYIIQTHTNRQPFNDHWAPYTNLCFPCKILYDFIGRFETMEKDVDSLLESIGVSDIIRFPRRNETYQTTETKDVLYQFYRNIDPHSIAKLGAIYANDSKHFGYTIQEEINKILRETRP